MTILKPGEKMPDLMNYDFKKGGPIRLEFGSAEGKKKFLEKLREGETKMTTLQKMGFYKRAKLELRDIERTLSGPYYTSLGGEKETKVRSMIEAEKARRFALRHPTMAGIPTLGIWPARAKHQAIEDIKIRLLRDDPEIRDAYLEAERLLEEKANREYDLETQRLKVTQAERTAGQVMGGLSTIAATALYDRRRREEE